MKLILLMGTYGKRKSSQIKIGFVHVDKFSMVRPAFFENLEYEPVTEKMLARRRKKNILIN